MFGVAHMKPFAHLALMTEKGHLVDAEGKDAYMPHVDRLAIPITFIHGERNNMVLPEGSRLTYEWLRKANGEALYSRVVIKEYAHMDSFIGKDSARDVFPMIQKELEGPVHSGGAAGARRKGS
jgi:cholesterol oxidase